MCSIVSNCKKLESSILSGSHSPEWCFRNTGYWFKSLNGLIREGLIEVFGKEYMLTAKMYETVKLDIEYTQDKVLQYEKAKGKIMEYAQETGSITNNCASRKGQICEICSR